MKSSDFAFDRVQSLYYKCHKKSKSYWIIYRFSQLDKNKKATINSINKKDNKCFQYTTTVELDHKETGKNSQRISKIKPFINKYNWEGINYPSEKDDWEEIGVKNPTIAFNLSFHLSQEPLHLLRGIIGVFFSSSSFSSLFLVLNLFLKHSLIQFELFNLNFVNFDFLYYFCFNFFQ